MLFNIIIINNIISLLIIFKYKNDNKFYYIFNANKKD